MEEEGEKEGGWEKGKLGVIKGESSGEREWGRKREKREGGREIQKGGREKGGRRREGGSMQKLNANTHTHIIISLFIITVRINPVIISMSLISTSNKNNLKILRNNDA